MLDWVRKLEEEKVEPDSQIMQVRGQVDQI